MTKRKRIGTETVLNAAVKLALQGGFQNLTRDEIAQEAGVSSGTVSQTYGTMIKLKRAVMRYAVQHELYPIIAVGISIGHPNALAAPGDIKRKALESLLNTEAL